MVCLNWVILQMNPSQFNLLTFFDLTINGYLKKESYWLGLVSSEIKPVILIIDVCTILDR